MGDKVLISTVVPPKKVVWPDKFAPAARELPGQVELNQKEFILKASEYLKVPPRDFKAALDTVLDAMENTLSHGYAIQIPGYFKIKFLEQTNKKGVNFPFRIRIIMSSAFKIRVLKRARKFLEELEEKHIVAKDKRVVRSKV